MKRRKKENYTCEDCGCTTHKKIERKNVCMECFFRATMSEEDYKTYKDTGDTSITPMSSLEECFECRNLVYEYTLRRGLCPSCATGVEEPEEEEIPF